MPAEAKARRRTPPPRRSKPYYDADLGRMRIVPPGGGKAVDYIGPKERQGFDARSTLRRVGVRAREEARATAGTARRVGSATPTVSPTPGFGSLLIYLVGSIVGLALLDALVSGRGPAAYGRLLGGFGRGFQKLLDPGDTLFARGQPPPASTRLTPTGPPAGALGPVGTGKVVVAAGADRPGVPTKRAVLDFIRKVASILGVGLVVTTGSQHNRLTVDGNVSQHWTGDAGDIGRTTDGRPLSGALLIKAGQAALIAAGADPAWARRQTGGLYEIGGHQIIFNTYEGGDHTDHLHVSD